MHYLKLSRNRAARVVRSATLHWSVKIVPMQTFMYSTHIFIDATSLTAQRPWAEMFK